LLKPIKNEPFPPLPAKDFKAFLIILSALSLNINRFNGLTKLFGCATNYRNRAPYKTSPLLIHNLRRIRHEKITYKPSNLRTAKKAARRKTWGLFYANDAAEAR